MHAPPYHWHSCQLMLLGATRLLLSFGDKGRHKYGKVSSLHAQPVCVDQSFTPFWSNALHVSPIVCHVHDVIS